MNRPKRLSADELQETVDDWNEKNAIGTAVRVRDDHGRESETKTRSLAWVMGGHSAMILLEGISGGYQLERVSPALSPAGDIDHGQEVRS